jgi:hypothetical protein
MSRKAWGRRQSAGVPPNHQGIGPGGLGGHSVSEKLAELVGQRSRLGPWLAILHKPVLLPRFPVSQLRSGGMVYLSCLQDE